MRIISGKYGGRIISAPKKDSVHPMSDRIRSAIFNKLYSQIEGAEVLDAFAGSGSVGFEALSRGANFVTFVEADRQVARTVNENIASLGCQDSTKLINSTVLNFASRNLIPKYDLIFVDPPYFNPQNSSVIILGQLLNPEGELILSNPKSAQTFEIEGLVVVDERTYADAKIVFYRKK